jgi:phosphatidylinositol alpha 1,6-mannosyltransferase
MRILIATDSFPPAINGVAQTASRLASMLARRGHDVRVVAPLPGPEAGEDHQVVRVPSVPFLLYPEFRLARPPFALLRDIAENPPDATVVLTPGSIGLSAARALGRCSRLVHVYTTDVASYARSYNLRLLSSATERVLHWLTERSAVTLCPTEFVREGLALRGHHRLDVWGRGVDTVLFDPARANPEMRWRLSGGEPWKPIVLYVGRLAREKQLLVLHEAARHLRGVRFALVGDGPQRDLLQRRFCDLPSVFTGYLRGQALASAFASADLFAFPSDSETFGQVVLQAMASGLPAVVPANSAPAELVPEGIAGMHVRPRSADDLASALSLLLNDPELRRRLGGGAKFHASQFSWDALVDRFEGFLSGTPVPPSKVIAPC